MLRRRIPRLALLLTAISAAPTLAFAGDGARSAARAPAVDQGKALDKVLDEAIRRDRDYTVDVRDEAQVRKAGRWVPVEAGAIYGPTDIAGSRVGSDFYADPGHEGLTSSADGAKLGRGVREVDYGTSGWRTASRWSTRPIKTRRPAALDDVVADLPVGTEIQVHLGREKVDGIKVLLAIDRGVAATQRRGYMTDDDADLGLAPADPALPTLIVTRQDPSLPAGEARLRQLRTRDLPPCDIYKRHERVTHRTRAQVRISPVRTR